MAAACHLLDSGHAVTLVERRPFLGGRAFSFFYPFQAQNTANAPVTGAAILAGSAKASMTRTTQTIAKDEIAGCQVDNGQHVFLGCCGYYIDFLRKLGTFDKTYLQPALSVKVVRPPKHGRKGKEGVLRASSLPAPFHLLPSFVKYPHLGLKDKLLAVYGLICIRFTNRSDPRYERQSLYEWLKAHGQTERAIENFWNLLILPTLNDHLKDVSAAMGLMVYQEGVLKSRSSANVGYSKVGLSELMGDAARDYILHKGGTLLLGKRVTRLVLEETGPSELAQTLASGRPGLKGVELAGGEIVRGDVYVSTLPFHGLASVMPPQLLHEPFFRGTKELSTAPIVNIHVWYDRLVMERSSTPFVAFVGSPLQWVFDKSNILESDGGDREPAERSPGQYICISVSGAWEYINRPKEEIREIFLKAMAEAFPRAREARVEQLLVVKSAATFRCTPGAAWLRPTTRTPVENLFLAGDWTDTGWPSTMEGAVISGVEAARAITSRGQSG